VALRHPVQRASFHFIGRIFGRSSRHRLFLAMYGGIGLAVAVSSLFVLRRNGGITIAMSPAGLLEAPLMLSFFVVSGLRATFNVPYELPANWIFQLTTSGHAEEFSKATRRWVFLRGVIPVYAVIAPVQFKFFETSAVLFQLAFGLSIAAVLIQLLFLNFNKVPFTCSYLPGKSHLAFLGGAYLYGFTVFTLTITNLQRWVGSSSQRTVGFFLCVLALLKAISEYRRRASKRITIVYEDQPDPLVRELNLT
jgi:hypothetical protein